LGGRQDFTGHMAAGGTLVRDQSRFASKRSDADDLLHPSLAPGAGNAMASVRSVRHLSPISTSTTRGNAPGASMVSFTIGNFRRTPLRCPFGPTWTNIDLIPRPYVSWASRSRPPWSLSDKPGSQTRLGIRSRASSSSWRRPASVTQIAYAKRCCRRYARPGLVEACQAIGTGRPGWHYCGGRGGPAALNGNSTLQPRFGGAALVA
jgi:hypothetical protein